MLYRPAMLSALRYAEICWRLLPGDASIDAAAAAERGEEAARYLRELTKMHEE